MTLLGNGLFETDHYADALSVFKASWLRCGALAHQNITCSSRRVIWLTHIRLGRCEEALRLQRDVYSGHLKLNGEEYYETLREANNYASSLIDLQRFKEARTLMRKTIHVTRRVLGEIMSSRSGCGGITRGRSSRHGRHARRSPRGRGDVRGDRTDRTARSRRRAPRHTGD